MLLNDTNYQNGDSNISSSFVGINKAKGTFKIYAKGYANAAKLLSNEFLEKSQLNDADGYPIIFLYRHALELYLKAIIYDLLVYQSYENLKPIVSAYFQPQKNKTHDLVELSKGVMKIMEEIARIEGDSEIQKLATNLEDISQQFNEIDKYSYSYRYPIDNEGNFSTHQNKIVNVASISDKLNTIFEEVETFLFMVEVNTYDLSRVLESF